MELVFGCYTLFLDSFTRTNSHLQKALSLKHHCFRDKAFLHLSIDIKTLDLQCLLILNKSNAIQFLARTN